MLDEEIELRRIGLAPDLIDAIYVEALLLADEARAWFDRYRSGYPVQAGTDDTDPLSDWAARNDPTMRIALSCESLRLTTRLMHIIAWLLQQRALAAGEMPGFDLSDPANRLGASPACDLTMLDAMPAPVVQLVRSSLALYDRVAALEAVQTNALSGQKHPVQMMVERLQAAI